ncbi:MAG: hypothetical protein K7J15_02525, partial [Candidatus Regiella insecticola]|nr:hypothetical protein [Candidatus Regiella insecticola]
NVAACISPAPLKLPLGVQGVKPMSLEILPDEANTRCQQCGGFKGEGGICKRRNMPVGGISQPLYIRRILL